MKKERYESLKRMAAVGSGASDNERMIALGLLNEVKVSVAKKEPRITVRKGVSGKSIVVGRKDGKGSCTIMMPLSEAIAIRFARQSLGIDLWITEEEMICRNLH